MKMPIHVLLALLAMVSTALAADGPTVIEAVVDSEHYLDTVYD